MDDPSFLEVEEDDWPLQLERDAERIKDAGSSRDDAVTTPLIPLGFIEQPPSHSGCNTGLPAQQSPRKVSQQLGSESGPLQLRHTNTGVKRPVAEAVLDSRVAVVAHAKSHRAGPDGRGPENTVPLRASQNRALATQQRTEEDQRIGFKAPKQQRIPGPAGTLLAVQQQGVQVQGLRDLCETETGNGYPAHSRGALQDHDFLSQSWAQGLAETCLSSFDEEGLPNAQHTIRSVLQLESSGKVAKMLVMVASLEPSGSHRDAFARLKDPSGSIGAGIHSSALAKHSRITVGSVLILELVTALKIPPSSCYLCVTASNVVKVIQAQNPTERPVALLPSPTRPEPRVQQAATWQDGIAQSQEVSQAFPSAQQDDGTDAAADSLSHSRRAAEQQAATDSEQIQPSNGPAGTDAGPPGEIDKFGSIEIDINLGDLGRKPAPPGQDEEYIGSLFNPVLSPAVGNQQGRGAAAIAGEDLAELMEGIDDEDEVARTGLWTPRH